MKKEGDAEIFDRPASIKYKWSVLIGVYMPMGVHAVCTPMSIICHCSGVGDAPGQSA